MSPLSKQHPDVLQHAMTKDKEGNDEDNDDSDKEANDGAGQLGWRGQLSTQVACSAFGHCTAVALHLIHGCCTDSSHLAVALLIQLTSADADPAKHCITLIQFICTLYHH